MSPELSLLLERVPLEKQSARERVVAGDFAFGAQCYAHVATTHGDSGEWWTVWRALQESRGLPLAAAIDELEPQGRRWFARWSFARASVDDGIAAYRAYLDRPGRIGPFEQETLTYLEALLSRGRAHDVLETVDELEQRSGLAAALTCVATEAHLSLAQLAEAASRLEPARAKYADDGRLWAWTAIVESRLGEEALALSALERAIRQQIAGDDRLVSRVERELGLAAGTIAARSAAFLPLDDEDAVRRWRASPGAALRRSAASPHHLGAGRVAMPACHGCAHPIRCYVLLDVRSEPRLAERLPQWQWLPLLGCPDCMMWMGRHDYRIDIERSEVRLESVGLSEEEFGAPYPNDYPTIPQSCVELSWREPRVDEDPWPPDDGPQVLGEPWWVQSPERVFCRDCHGEMLFMAAMGSTEPLGFSVPITNESGFLYHFACAGCRTLSVIAQWT